MTDTANRDMTEEQAFEDVIERLEAQRSLLSKMLDRAGFEKARAGTPLDRIKYELLQSDITAELARVRSNILVLNLNKPSMVAAYENLVALSDAAKAEAGKIDIATAKAKQLSELLKASTKFVEGVGKLVGVFS
jgi:hypothetical protein